MIVFRSAVKTGFSQVIHCKYPSSSNSETMASKQINNTSRDIKRRIDLITKNTELKALRVPAAVMYSTTKTKDIYVLGDSRITQVTEKYRDEILMNPDSMEEDALYTTTVMLAPLPAKLSMTADS